jgi:DNA-binding transcriptional LysR family regulator
VLPDYLAAPRLRAGDLVAVLNAWTLPRIPVHAFHAPTRRRPRAIVEVLEAMRSAVRRLRSG